jgi:hypothetical protein
MKASRLTKSIIFICSASTKFSRRGRETLNQRRRRGIFVENRDKIFQAPSGATSSEYAAPTELFHFVNGGLQRCRADGASKWRRRETLKEKLKPYLQTGEWMDGFIRALLQRHNPEKSA